MAWQCVKHCGACCYLGDRANASEYLTLSEQEALAAMIGEDGWCVYFDHAQRQCSVYDQRPDFCCVSVGSFLDRYGVEPDEFDEFAIACCQEHIAERYGCESPEMLRFNAAT